MGYKFKTLSLFLFILIVGSIFVPVHSLTNKVATQSASEMVLTVYTDKSLYILGELVRILGTTQELNGTPIEGVAIGIEVKDPRNNTIFLDGTYSLSDGTYQSNFRLPANAPVGQYNVYVTAHKTGYQTATNQTSFYASTEELGETTISIAGHSIDLENSNSVSGILNVTMFSKSITSTVVSTRLILVDPEGTTIHDNFQGIGTPTDLKLTTINNNSISTVNFQFPPPPLKAGYYTHMFSIFDGYGASIYDSTSWLPAFFHMPDPSTIIDLGTLAPDSSLFETLTLTMIRFDSVRFSFILLQPIESLSLSLGASSPSKFMISLNQTELTAESILHEAYTWKVYNLPSGTYHLTITTLSNTASLSSISIQSGAEITAPSVQISTIETTSESATPNGTMSYHVYIDWNITTLDTLILSAELQGNIEDTVEYGLEPLHGNHKDFYLTVTAPSEAGNYTVYFNATLKEALVSSLDSATLLVQYGPYNITLSPEIKYYKMPPSWQFWDRNPITVEDPAQLSALDVADIKIAWINAWNETTGKPTNATISFKTHNKLTGEILETLKFGEGVHYEVHIKFGSEDYLLAVLIAGDTKTIYAHNIPIISDNLSFTLVYKIWWLGEVFEITASVLKSAVAILIQGLKPALVDLAMDAAKLSVLYTLQIWIEQEKGYLVTEDIVKFLTDLGIEVTSDIIGIADKTIAVTGNPFFALFRAIIYTRMTGKIDLIKFVYAIFKLIVYVSGKALPTIAETLQKAVILGFQKIGITLTENINQHIDAKQFLWKINVILSISEMCFTIARLLGAPSEEGKELTNAGVSPDSAITVDPLISVNYSGPTSNTNLTYFEDINTMIVNITEAQAKIVFIADSNLTSTFLPTFSDEIYRRDMLAILGFNVTETNLEWYNGSNVFTIYGNGSTYLGLNKLSLSLNSTWIQGYSQMSADAIQIGNSAWFNSSLIYPFGKNLIYTIRVELPANSTILQILSDGNYTLQENVVTWNTPIDWLAIEFVSPHDITVTNVTMPKTVVGQGIPLNFNVTITNQGELTETFNVTAYANTTIIATLSNITLTSGNSTTLTFTWNTTGVAYGNYTISATATIIPGETDKADNTYTDGTVLVTIAGDVNGDGIVNVLDLTALGKAFGSTLTSPNWNANADINDDLIISVLDLYIVGKNYRQTNPNAESKSLNVYHAWAFILTLLAAVLIVPEFRKRTRKERNNTIQTLRHHRPYNRRHRDTTIKQLNTRSNFTSFIFCLVYVSFFPKNG